MTQANTVATVLAPYGVPHWATGLVLGGLTALVVLGGVRRIAEVAAVLVPGMCAIYVAGALFVLLTHLSELPAAIELVVRSAFTGQAAVGGFVGASVRAAMQSGIARGLFSSEAGLGSTPMLHVAAVTDHPVRQATFGIVANISQSAPS